MNASHHSHDHGHHHAHDRGHTHSHGHNHAPKDFGRAFFFGIVLNTAFIITEIIFGVRANSLALLADAGHNISDVAGLFLAWGAVILAKKQASQRFTYGLRSASIIAALMNAVFLFIAIGGIGWEAIKRLIHAEVPAGETVMIVAGMGIVINGVTAWLFMGGSKNDLNIKGAFWHMASDALVSLGVVMAGFMILKTGWTWLDPLVSLVVMVVILLGTWGLFRDSLALSLHAVPSAIDYAKVKAYLAAQSGITEVHDLHIWAISTTESALSVHLVMPDGHPGDAFLFELAEALEHHYHIDHSTFQIELGDGAAECPLGLCMK